MRITKATFDHRQRALLENVEKAARAVSGTQVLPRAPGAATLQWAHHNFARRAAANPVEKVSSTFEGVLSTERGLRRKEQRQTVQIVDRCMAAT